MTNLPKASDLKHSDIEAGTEFTFRDYKYGIGTCISTALVTRVRTTKTGRIQVFIAADNTSGETNWTHKPSAPHTFLQD